MSIDNLLKVSLSQEPLLILIPLLLFLALASFWDIKYRKIPNKLNLLFFILRIGMIPFVGISWGDIGGAVFLFLFFLIGAMILNVQMGGDIKAVPIIGLYIGFIPSIIFVFLTTITLVIIALLSLAIKRKSFEFPCAPAFLSSVCILIMV